MLILTAKKRNTFVFLGLIFLGLLFYGLNLKAAASFLTVWQEYKQHFLEKSGRVIDTGHADKISHSEGQGYGLLLATQYNDHKAFEQIWTWTQEHLQKREDALFSWSWSPKTGQITDQNNATDGDILIAWGLLKGATLWNEPRYQTEAKKILASIKKKLIYQHPHYGVLLLPGEYGFLETEKNQVTVNLSYWVFPAFKQFMAFEPEEPLWPALFENGQQLVRTLRFGAAQLPADWVRLNLDQAHFDLETRYPPRFSYDAIRIPLYLKWAEINDPALFEPFARFWTQFAGQATLPAWIDLKTQERDPLDANKTIRSIVHLVAPSVIPTIPAYDPAESYYNTTLYLFTTQIVKK